MIEPPKAMRARQLDAVLRCMDRAHTWTARQSRRAALLQPVWVALSFALGAAVGWGVR